MAEAAGIDVRTSVPPSRAPWPSLRRRVLAVGVLAVVAVSLFMSYLRMSRTQPMNADGASQALQGWDLLHGNVLLAGWTVSDVSFYANEVVLFALVQGVNGLNADAVHIVAAILYTLLVVVVALVAKGRATGRDTVACVAVALAIMLVPAAGMGSLVLLGSADHTGTGVPLLLTWLFLDLGLTRRDNPRWFAYAVCALLVWGQVSDPLVMFVGALPLVLVSGLRMWRARSASGMDARLFMAGLASVVVAQGIVAAIGAAGGYRVHGVPIRFVHPGQILNNLSNTVETLAVNFGGYLPDRNGALDVGMGAVRLVGVIAVVAAVVVIAVRILRQRSGGRVEELLTIGIAVNLGAFLVSTLPADLTSARQITGVLILGAALAGRVWGPRFASLRWLPVVVAAMTLVYGGEFVARTSQPPVPPANAQLAAWLESRNLSYGLGGFWTSNDISLITSGRVRIAPVVEEERTYAYRWLSNEDWYNPDRHDARFVIIDRLYPPHGTDAGTVASFGAPVERHDIGRHTVLVYDHNLLVGLSAECLPGQAPSITDCGNTHR